MSSQLALDLFAPITCGTARKRDPQTSIHAARVCRAESQRSRIASTLASHLYGLTTEQLEDELHVVRNTLAARLKQMERDDEVYSLGVRLNREGNPQKIWFWRTPPAQEVDVEVAERWL